MMLDYNFQNEYEEAKKRLRTRSCIFSCHRQTWDDYNETQMLLNIINEFEYNERCSICWHDLLNQESFD